MINKVPGQRWAFNNVGTCTRHVTAQFVVEIVTINEYYSCTVRTIQSSSQVFKLGKNGRPILTNYVIKVVINTSLDKINRKTNDER